MSKPVSDWANLPEELLLKIFSYLKIKERFNPSLVCRHWAATFQTPMLWRNFVLIINDNENNKLALRFADTRYAHWLKRLIVKMDLYFERPSNYDPRNAISFFKILESKTQLNELLLKWWIAFCSFRITMALWEFLQSQNQLRILNFFMISEVPEFVKALESATFNCHESIEVLELNTSYGDKLHKFTSDFIRIISRLNKLRILHLHCKFLNEPVLKALAQFHGSKLELFRIVWTTTHFINPSDLDWELLRYAFKDIKVALLNSYFDFEALELENFLPKEMPLSEVHFNTRSDLIPSHGRLDVIYLLEYLQDNFCNTLEVLFLNVHFEVPYLNMAVMFLLNKCTKLQKFNFGSKLPVSFYENVCRFCLERPSSFKKLTLNIESAADLQHLKAQYGHLLAKKGVECILVLQQNSE